MSGGSFNYLFCKDAPDFFGYAPREDLERMAAALTDAGDAEDAARETEEILAIIAGTERRVDARLERLRGVWKAMEWWKSGDGGEDGLRAALTKYREGQP
jgi:hypothetical protein